MSLLDDGFLVFPHKSQDLSWLEHPASGLHARTAPPSFSGSTDGEWKRVAFFQFADLLFENCADCRGIEQKFIAYKSTAFGRCALSEGHHLLALAEMCRWS